MNSETNVPVESGDYALSQDDFAAALSAYEEALRGDPDSTEIMWRCGYAFYRLGRYAEAAPHYAGIVRQTPNSFEAHQGLRVCYVQMGRYDEVIPVAEQNIRLNPDDAQAYVDLAYAYAFLGRYTESDATLDRLQERGLTHESVDALRGEATYRLGRYDEALASYQRAAEADPENVSLQYNIGLAATNLGDSERAHAAFERVLDDPDFPLAERATAAYHLGRYDEALLAYLRAAEADPVGLSLPYYAGLSALQIGDMRRARDAFRWVFDAQPDYLQVRLNLGVAEATLGNHAMALALLERAAKTDPDAASVYNALWRHLGLGQRPPCPTRWSFLRRVV